MHHNMEEMIQDKEGGGNNDNLPGAGVIKWPPSRTENDVLKMKDDLINQLMEENYSLRVENERFKKDLTEAYKANEEWRKHSEEDMAKMAVMEGRYRKLQQQLEEEQVKHSETKNALSDVRQQQSKGKNLIERNSWLEQETQYQAEQIKYLQKQLRRYEKNESLKDVPRPDWSCDRCTYDNPGEAEKCAMCDFDAPVRTHGYGKLVED